MTTPTTARHVSLAATLLTSLFAAVGCTSTTHVTFNGPPGKVLFIDSSSA